MRRNSCNAGFLPLWRHLRNEIVSLFVLLLYMCRSVLYSVANINYMCGKLTPFSLLGDCLLELGKVIIYMEIFLVYVTRIDILRE